MGCFNLNPSSVGSDLRKLYWQDLDFVFSLEYIIDLLFLGWAASMNKRVKPNKIEHFVTLIVLTLKYPQVSQQQFKEKKRKKMSG